MNVEMIHLVGRATRDVELSESKNGKKYAKFSIAVNNHVKGEKEDTVQYYNILVFEKQAESAEQNVKTGDIVVVTGRPEFEAYTSKKDEAKVSVTILPQYWQVLK